MGCCKFVKLPPSNIDRSRCTNLVAQRRTSFEKCLTVLQHASQCSKSMCEISCVKMKRVLAHFKEATISAVRNTNKCSVCVQFIELVRCHSEKCQTQECAVVLCATFKREAKKTIAPVYQFPIPDLSGMGLRANPTPERSKGNE
jgi:hypothetical protein